MKVNTQKTLEADQFNHSSPAISEIERLEAELAQTKQALRESLSAQNLMSENLNKCAEMLNVVESQLKSTQSTLNLANNRVNTCIERLSDENKKLKLSVAFWIKRSINLNFELLVANDAMKKNES